MQSYIKREPAMIAGSLISGVAIYLILSYLLMPAEITLPLSVIMSLIVYGLTRYYYLEERINSSERKAGHSNTIKIAFGASYAFSIILILFSYPNDSLFSSWDSISLPDLVRLAAAIGITIFFPGFALINLIDKKNELGQLPRLLLSYIFSIFLSTIVGYLFLLMNLNFSDIRIVLSVINAAILALYLLHLVATRGLKGYHSGIRYPRQIRNNASEILVLSALLALVAFSTYYLYNGMIVGDQWLHHGRSYLFLSGVFGDYATTGADFAYPPIFSSFLSTLFSISSMPSINTYVSINFLNIMPAFAFYYFFSRWVPDRKRASLIATVLFMISSGFGWVYLLDLANDSPSSQESILDTIDTAGAKTFDIWLPNNFINVGHPDITTGLIIFALPAGFVLLGLLREQVKSKVRYFALFAAVATLGYMSHDETGLFLIVAAAAALIFRLKDKTVIYPAILTALAFATLTGIFAPDHYYISRIILGVPSILLYFPFIAVLWAVYIVQNVRNHTERQQPGAKTENKTIRVLSLVLISAVCYLYLLSFVVWDIQSDLFDVRINTDDFRIVQWHFYPLRLGVTGLLAFAYILSRIFHKYEKEVFIFGIVALVAFITGPYYNDHRFNKYIMASMAGFAALLIYRILSSRLTVVNKPLLSGMIIGLIISSASLSLLMYIGYVALATQDLDFRKFNEALPKRHQPPFELLQVLRNNLDLKADNIAIPATVLNVNLGPAPAIQGFTGLTYERMVQSPSTLQTSNLEGLFTLLNFSSSRFVLLDKHDDQSFDLMSSQFVLENFQILYEDSDYILLSAPKVAPPSSNGEVALILPRLDITERSSLAYQRSLEYDNIDFAGLQDNILLSYVNENAILDGTSTIWSQPIREYVNSAELNLRILEEKQTDNHSGIVWDDGEKTYYVFLRTNKLAVYTESDGEFSTPIDPRQNGTWYNLKIIYDDNSINVFLDQEQVLQIDKPSSSSGILRVGVRSFNTASEFEPLAIGKIHEQVLKLSGTDKKIIYDYPISMLALSNSRYDTYFDGDLSAQTRNTILVPFDPINVDKYLNYANAGGTIIAVNTSNDLGSFGTLLDLEFGEEVEFTGITGNNSSLEVSGKANYIESRSAETVPISYYTDNNQIVTPFAFEKEYGEGKIIFVNSLGYFNAVLSSPRELFITLEDIPQLLDLDIAMPEKSNHISGVPASRFTGDLSATDVMIHSQSIFIPTNQDVQVERISINGPGLRQSLILPQDGSGNVGLSNLTLIGDYQANINSTNAQYLPSSEYSYVSFAIPDAFDMKLHLTNSSRAIFTLSDGRSYDTSDSEISFQGVRLEDKIMMKRPEIEVNGKTSFVKLHSNHPSNPTRPWADGIPAEFEGNLRIRLEHIDVDPDTTVRSITYFTWIENNAKASIPDIPQKPLKLLDVPLEQAIYSEYNLVILPVVAAIALIVRSKVSRSLKTHQ